MSGICERGHGYYPGQRCPDCPTAATGDSGAVPDSGSVPSGDSVTLIETISLALVEHGNWTRDERKDQRNAARAALAVLELRESDRQSEPTVQRISEMTNDSLLHYGDVTVHRLASGWWVSKNSGANTLARSPERALFYIRRRSNDA